MIEEDFRRSCWIILRSRQERRTGAGQDNAGNAVGTMAREIANDLAAACRVADQRDPFQIEVGEQSRQIISQRVELIAKARIIRAAVTAPVMGDATQPLI